MKTLCIYHGSGCVDGFASAWVVHRALGDTVEFVAASYGDDPPGCWSQTSTFGLNMPGVVEWDCELLTGRDVLIVDFSYKRPVLYAMAASARSVLVLDHHKSAAEDLADIASPMVLDISGGKYEMASYDPRSNIAASFDMNRSGAGITWDFFNPGVPRPWFINLVEDRDLWRFNDDRSRPFHAAVTSYPLDFTLWDSFCHYRNGEASILINEGTAILRKHDLDVQTVIHTTRRTMVIGGVRVPVCNCPPWLASDVGHELYINTPLSTFKSTDPINKYYGDYTVIVPFSATYYDRDGSRNFSLRSRPDGADVSKICALYGGGGHRNAGGFQRPQGWEGDE